MESDAEVLDRTVAGDNDHAEGVTAQKVALCG